MTKHVLVAQAKNIIFLSGQKRAGKDTVARFLKQLDPSIKIVSFASPMKQILSDTFNIPTVILDDYKNESYGLMHGLPTSDNRIEDEAFGIQTYRSIIQQFGQACRAHISDTIWIDKTIDLIEEYFRFTDTVVISDWRFPLEFEEVQRYFTEETYVAHGDMVDSYTAYCWAIRIDKDGLVEDSHISENALSGAEIDWAISNNGTLEELKEQAKNILKEIHV